MASDPPKRSDDDTEAETVKRRLIDAVRERIDEIERTALDVDASRDRRRSPGPE